MKLGFEKMLVDEFAKHDVMYWTDHAIPVELVTRKPIRTFADFKGKKIRSSGTFAKFFNELGANAMYVAGTEIYTGLATGIFEGAHWGGVTGANSLGLYEVCKYHMKPSLAHGSEEGFFINKKAFEKLPLDIQQTVKKILDKLFYIRTDEYANREAETFAQVKDKHKITVVTLSEEDQKKMAQAAVKIWDEVGKSGPNNAKAVEIIKSYLKENNRL